MRWIHVHIPKEQRQTFNDNFEHVYVEVSGWRWHARNSANSETGTMVPFKYGGQPRNIQQMNYSRVLTNYYQPRALFGRHTFFNGTNMLWMAWWHEHVSGLIVTTFLWKPACVQQYKDTTYCLVTNKLRSQMANVNTKYLRQLQTYLMGENEIKQIEIHTHIYILLI